MAAWTACGDLAGGRRAVVDELLDVLADRPDLGGELVDALLARAAGGLEAGGDHRRSGRSGRAAPWPAASRPSSCSSGWRRSRAGRRRSASGLTSLTTSGTSGSIRNALELSTTSAPASANRCAQAREVVAPALNSARSKPPIVSSASGRQTRPSSSVAAGRALGGEGDELGVGEPLVGQAAHDGADGTGGSDDRDAHGPKASQRGGTGSAAGRRGPRTRRVRPGSARSARPASSRSRTAG